MTLPGAAASEAMRRILVDNARRKMAARHGGGHRRAEYHENSVAVDPPVDNGDPHWLAQVQNNPVRKRCGILSILGVPDWPPSTLWPNRSEKFRGWFYGV
jgi:hypothetical protein